MSATETITETSISDSYHSRAYGISNPAEAQAVYNEWAKMYDAHTQSKDNQYVAPTVIADAVAEHVVIPTDDNDLLVLDAGCGTGLAGVALIARLKHNSSQSPIANKIVIDGLDISQSMLDIAAKTTAYRHLQTADLNQPLSTSLGIADASYDVVTCVGTLTMGHVGPSVLTEFVRVTKPGGLIAATIHEKIWESHGFKAEINRLKQEGNTKVLQEGLREYRKVAGVKAMVVVLRKVNHDL